METLPKLQTNRIMNKWVFLKFVLCRQIYWLVGGYCWMIRGMCRDVLLDTVSTSCDCCCCEPCCDSACCTYSRHVLGIVSFFLLLLLIQALTCLAQNQQKPNIIDPWSFSIYNCCHDCILNAVLNPLHFCILLTLWFKVYLLSRSSHKVSENRGQVAFLTTFSKMV